MTTTIKSTDSIVIAALVRLIEQKIGFGVLIYKGQWISMIPSTIFINENGKLRYKDAYGTVHSVTSWIKTEKNMKTVQWLQHLHFVDPTDGKWIKFHSFIVCLIAIQSGDNRHIIA